MHENFPHDSSDMPDNILNAPEDPEVTLDLIIHDLASQAAALNHLTPGPLDSMSDTITWRIRTAALAAAAQAAYEVKQELFEMKNPEAEVGPESQNLTNNME